jgi:hypothetical protein
MRSNLVGVLGDVGRAANLENLVVELVKLGGILVPVLCGGIVEERDRVASFVPLDNAQLKARLEREPKAEALFKELGPD